MAFDLHQLRNEIEDALDQIGVETKQAKALILTEDDLKCLIYKRLTELPSLSMLHQTMNPNILTSMVHVELPWYDGSGQLTIKPDITIVQPEHLSILHGYYDLNQPHRRKESSSFFGRRWDANCGERKLPKVPPLPRKQFEFGGRAIIFELKFVREPSGITKSILKEQVIPDYDKINHLFEILEAKECSNDVFAYQVIFSKTGRACPEFHEFRQRHGESIRHKIIYKSLGVFMPYKRL